MKKILSVFTCGILAACACNESQWEQVEVVSLNEVGYEQKAEVKNDVVIQVEPTPVLAQQEVKACPCAQVQPCQMTPCCQAHVAPAPQPKVTTTKKIITTTTTLEEPCGKPVCEPVVTVHYIPGQSIAGNVDIQVADTNIGLGGYLMKIVSDQVRIYGNAFLDMHILDVKRDQNYVGTIDGDGAAFSLISEWGIMHDLLNQYVVGNLYARAGYNFGFEVKEKVGGDDYMRLQSDGYAILTPGYSVTAQKRIYPSAWFQIRPYASIGVEYDILGAPDTLEYKFAPADSYTKYSVENDPLWMNIGGGVEVLSARGLQFGIDYRYQYNSEIQLHNVRFSGSYRF